MIILKYVLRLAWFFQVHISDAESKAGLQISPSERVVMVTKRPVLDVVFSQFRAKVSGVIACIGKEGLLLYIYIFKAIL